MKNTMRFSLLTLATVLFLSSCGNWHNSDDYKNNITEVKNEIKTNNIVEKNDKFKMNDKIWKDILVDKNGMALYVFKKDTENVSNCSWECEVKWPVYYNADLKEGDFWSIKREDWSMQTTYKWFPLYYFFKDTKAWDVNWNKIKDVWFVVDKNVSSLNNIMKNN